MPTQRYDKSKLLERAKLWEQGDAVRSKEDLAEFLVGLKRDLGTNDVLWGNTSLDGYLGALSKVVKADYQGMPVANLNLPPDAWRALAFYLSAAADAMASD